MAKEEHQGVSEQSKVVKHRRDDAQVLFDGGRWRGAMYLAGYSVECLLKTKLMRMFGARHLSALEEELQRRGLLASRMTVFTYQLEQLLRLAHGLERLRANAGIRVAFRTANTWIPAWRYSADLSSREDAEAFLTAVDRVLHWVENNI